MLVPTCEFYCFLFYLGGLSGCYITLCEELYNVFRTTLASDPGKYQSVGRAAILDIKSCDTNLTSIHI